MRRAMRCGLAIFAFALLAAGCGGEPAADPAALATPTPGVAADGTTVAATPLPADGQTAALTDAPPGVNEISGADAAVGRSVKMSALTPKKFKQAHCAKPIMVVYHQPGATVDAKLLAEARAAASSIEDVVLLTYTPADVRTAGDLPSKLGLFSTPGLATVGRDGKIENFWVTYVDRALIQLSLRNAEKSKPCKVGSGEVPEAGSAMQDAALVASGGTLEDAPTDPLAGSQPGTPAVDAAGVGAGGAGAVDPMMGLPAS